MSKQEHIVIRGYGSISQLGHNKQTITNSYRDGKPNFHYKKTNGVELAVGALLSDSEAILSELRKEKKAYQDLDRSVLMAIHAGRQAIEEAGWTNDADIAVNVGSSRGATELFEQNFQEFLINGKVSAQTSPVTTLGNISSWVAQDLSTTGPSFSHSVTCSSGIQAFANAFAWLKADISKKFLAGASEAPLTPFTIAQMKAMGIYSTDTNTLFPCRPHNSERKNTFVLGEGAAIFALEKVTDEKLVKFKSRPIIVDSIGLGFETIHSKTGISKEGINFQLAVQNAIENSRNTAPIDLVIMHAPGTVAGDSAELNALKKVFNKDHFPIISSSKWLVGHTLGASACLSIDYALHILKTQSLLPLPYPNQIDQNIHKPIKRILVTAAGFGGNAAAIILSNDRMIE